MSDPKDIFICRCGCGVDPTICGCGTSKEAHGNPMNEGHSFVPMGCNCLRSDPKDTAAMIAEARELDRTATPGPWAQIAGKVRGYLSNVETPEEWIQAGSDSNAAFIARARTLLPALADALEAREHWWVGRMDTTPCLVCGVHRDTHPQPGEGRAPLEAEIAILRVENERLTAERDEAVTRADAAERLLAKADLEADLAALEKP